MEATSAKRHKTLPALELLGTPSRLYDHMEHSKFDFKRVAVYSRFSKTFLEMFCNNAISDFSEGLRIMMILAEMLSKSLKIRNSAKF